MHSSDGSRVKYYHSPNQHRRFKLPTLVIFCGHYFISVPWFNRWCTKLSPYLIDKGFLNFSTVFGSLCSVIFIVVGHNMRCKCPDRRCPLYFPLCSVQVWCPPPVPLCTFVRLQGSCLNCSIVTVSSVKCKYSASDRDTSIIVSWQQLNHPPRRSTEDGGRGGGVRQQQDAAGGGGGQAGEVPRPQGALPRGGGGRGAGGGAVPIQPLQGDPGHRPPGHQGRHTRQPPDLRR